MGTVKAPPIPKSMQPWWKEIDFTSLQGDDTLEYIISIAQRRLVFRRFPVRTAREFRLQALLDDGLLAKIKELFKGRGGHTVYEMIDPSGHVVISARVWDRGLISFVSPDGLPGGYIPDDVQSGPFRCTVHVITDDEADVRMLLDLLGDRVATEISPSVFPAPHHIFALAMMPDGTLGPAPLGSFSIPLERDNYGDTTLEAYDRAIKDLSGPVRQGRLTVISGESGSGKTALVRGMIAELPSAKFLWVPPQLFPHLLDPPLLLKLNEIIGRPLVLVIEHADHLIQNTLDGPGREFVAMLNTLGDSIMGYIIDCRIVLTTSTYVSEATHEAFRAGRMANIIRTGKLTEEQVKKIWRNIGGPEESPPGKDVRMLAQVYQHFQATVKSEEPKPAVEKTDPSLN